MNTSSKRRQSRGSAWHWSQTDSWYFTPPGTKRRVPLTDENGRRIRGAHRKQAALLALARRKVDGQWRPSPEPIVAETPLVAKLCSEYIVYCERGASNGTLSREYRDSVVRFLNDWCSYCGAMPVSQINKGHLKHWLESHATWRSPSSHRNAIAAVVAAFNHGQEEHEIPNPLKGYKKPRATPRLQPFSAEDEKLLYGNTDQAFGDFLFAAIHTGLRPFCELGCLTAADVIETERGMMWRVYSSKTKKTRKIPVRTEVAELTRRLLKAAPTADALLFRNTADGPWKRVTGGQRFARIRRRLGWDKNPLKRDLTCYSSRHTFAHRMLSGYWNGGMGCSIEVLAELIGDTPKVAYDHYGKEWGQHYQDPLWTAIGMSGR